MRREKKEMEQERDSLAGQSSSQTIMRLRCWHYPKRTGAAIREILEAGTGPSSENDTAPRSAFPLVDSEQGSSRGGFEHIVDAITSQAAALEVFPRANLLFHVLACFPRDEFLAAFSHLLLCDGVVTQIFLQADQDDGYARTALGGLVGPFVLDVF